MEEREYVPRINFTMFEVDFSRETMFVFQLCNHLSAHGCTVSITALGRGYEHSWFPLAIKPRYLPPPGTGKRKFLLPPDRSIECIPSLERAVRELAGAVPTCDVNVAAQAAAVYPVMKSGKGVPFHLVQSFEPLFEDHPHTVRWLENAYRLPLRSMVTCGHLSLLLGERTGTRPLKLLPGIDHTVYKPGVPVDTGRNGRPLVVCPQEDNDWKGFDVLAEMMILVSRERGDVEFIACGKNPPPLPLSVPCRFHRAASPEELADLFRSADVVACSTPEGISPLAPLEAMACAAPVVTTSPGTEDYACSGVNSLVVPAGDASSMAWAVLEILSDRKLSDRLRAEGTRTAASFTWSRTTGRFLEYIADCLPGGHRQPGSA